MAVRTNLIGLMDRKQSTVIESDSNVKVTL
jgi:hypothetical protein